MGKKQKNVVSKFFSGDSITKTSIKSLYGEFVDAIKSIFTTEKINLQHKYKIPTIIVIGAESSGKSSLLENITKCPMFPRNAKICTKQPIYLKLHPSDSDNAVSYSYEYKNVTTMSSKKTICSEIEAIMNELNSDNISEEIITINICDENLPHFEFIDLPGIRAYPEQLAKNTYDMAEKFILKPDTIILCVVPATTPRLTSYTPIALVKKHNKEKRYRKRKNKKNKNKTK